MPNQKRKLLAIVGAGPKGIATAIKVKVLEEFGLPVDQVVLIEKNKVAANWSGDYGYTNGEMKLGTSPEKDVVFPIETDVGNTELNRKIHNRLLQFTWSAFLVQTKNFSDWVDRGRPAPSHLLWSEYLRWVSLQLEPQVKIVTGHVTSIDLTDNGTQWTLKMKNSAKRLVADRLMLTGPGETRLDFIVAKSDKLPQGVFDLETFWSTIKSKSLPSMGRLAIIGAGENAASILLALSKYAPDLTVDVISPKGFISTRAESFYENQMYSQPERSHWNKLELKHRVDFIERTDLGVFSVHAMSILNEQRRHKIVPGRVVELKTAPKGVELVLKYADKTESAFYDQVVIASGFDQVGILEKYLSNRCLLALQSAIGADLNQTNLSQTIQPDLSVAGLLPALHLPMLSGIQQGPGFANLSCLGRLSDRLIALPLLDRQIKYENQPLQLIGGGL